MALLQDPTGQAFAAAFTELVVAVTGKLEDAADVESAGDRRQEESMAEGFVRAVLACASLADKEAEMKLLSRVGNAQNGHVVVLRGDTGQSRQQRLVYWRVESGGYNCDYECGYEVTMNVTWTRPMAGYPCCI